MLFYFLYINCKKRENKSHSVIGTFEIDLICLVKAVSEEDAKKIVCERNGKKYNEELKKHIEITAKKIDYIEGYFQYKPSEY